MKKILFFFGRVYICLEGNIKNSINSKSHSNIKNCNLIQVINSESFKYLDEATKDRTDICSDCELRYICVDSRVPIKKDNGRWYHQTDCGYNPYLCVSSDEENYKSCFECDIFSTKTEFTINHYKIDQYKKILWNL